MINRIKRKVRRIIGLSLIDLQITAYNVLERRKQKKKIASKLMDHPVMNDIFLYNSDKKRSVEFTKNDLILTEVVVTCYFTLKPDPQTGFSRNTADFKYIEPWYDSLLKTGANGIILHDGLEAEFIKKYQTQNIQFRLCEMGNYSIFEERWILYHIFLKQLPQLEKVFFTDSNDVYITRNPFTFITTETALYVGRDNANRIKDSGWLKEECMKFLEESNYKLAKTYEYQWVYNAGVTGGSLQIMLLLTHEISKLIFQTSSNFHKDMTLLNIVIHENFYPKLSKVNWDKKLVDTSNDDLSSHSNLITGYPFNSGFKDHDLHSKAYFIHK